MESLLQTVLSYAEKKNQLFLNDAIVGMKNCLPINITEIAEKYYLGDQDDHYVEDLKLVKPNKYPNPAWFEFVFPKNIRLEEKLSAFLFAGKRGGVYIEWRDNESDIIPQTLLVMLVVEEDAATLSSPQYVQIPIGLNGYIYGDRVQYLITSSVMGVSRDNLDEFFGFFVTPVFLALDEAIKQEASTQ